LQDAAIREAERRSAFGRTRRLIGRLDDLITNSGYLVAPFIGVVDDRSTT
jgi:hypothetical protein